MTLAVKRGKTSAMINNSTRAVWYSSISLAQTRPLKISTVLQIFHISISALQKAYIQGFLNKLSPRASGFYFPVVEEVLPIIQWLHQRSDGKYPSTTLMRLRRDWDQHCKQLIIFQWECGSVVSTREKLNYKNLILHVHLADAFIQSNLQMKTTEAINCSIKITKT